MANSNNRTPKKKHTFADVLKVYKKRFAKLDKKTKIQISAIAVLIVLIVLAAVMALMGRGKNPVSSSNITGSSMSVSGSYDPLADEKYEDEYLRLIEEYDDVIIPENNKEDRNYFKETLFVGDSNTEGLATYNHLSLQYVLGMTGMPIQAVTTNKCMWFVGYEEPVTIPTAVGMLKPRRIIINFGTNNAGGTETEDFIYSYENALNAIEKAYPYADIIVSAVLPVAKVRDYPSITMQDIDDFNLALAEMCRDRGLKFLNTAEMFKDPDNGFMKTEYIAKDGIHLTREGYQALLEYVGSHKHIVPDNRPARGTIPTRRNAPYVPEGSSSLASSSVVSSSRPISSSMMSSSIIASSSMVPSSSIGASSAVSSSLSSSSVPASSETVSSSQENISSSSQRSSEEAESSSEPVVVCTYCNAEGHLANQCDKSCQKEGHVGLHSPEDCPDNATPPPVCGLCGAEGHTSADCAQSCQKDGHKGLHLAANCPDDVAPPATEETDTPPTE